MAALSNSRVTPVSDERPGEGEWFPDLLVVGLEDWDEVERRHQLLLREVLGMHPGCRVLFVEAPARLTPPARLRGFAVRQVADSVFRTRVVRPLPEWSHSLRTVNDACEAAQLRRALSRISMAKPLLWTKASRSVGMLERLPISGVVFDLTDDWSLSTDSRRTSLRLRVEMEQLSRRANAVVACSGTLAETAAQWNECTYHVPNAVEPPGPPQPVPPELEGLPRPIFGYAGTLHESRLDIDLIVAGARIESASTFVFLGPDLLSRRARRRLFSSPNIHYLGVRPHSRVRAYLEAFDVCLIPHRVTDFTRGLDPLKLYEYLAAGRPIVSTPLPMPPELSEYVVHAHTPAELVRLARRELETDSPSRRQARKAAVLESTWTARARQVEQIVAAAGLAR